MKLIFESWRRYLKEPKVDYLKQAAELLTDSDKSKLKKIIQEELAIILEGDVIQGPWGDIPDLEPGDGPRPVDDYMDIARQFRGDRAAIRDLPTPPGEPPLHTKSTVEEIAAALKHDEDLWWAKQAPDLEPGVKPQTPRGDPRSPTVRQETLRNVKAMEKRTPGIKEQILKHPKIQASLKKRVAAGAFAGFLIWQLLEGLANATEKHGPLVDEEGNINAGSVKAHGIELGKFGISAVDPTGIAEVGYGIYDVLSHEDPALASREHGIAIAEMFGIPTPSDAGPEGIKPGSAIEPDGVIATVAPDWLEIWNPVGEEEGFTMEYVPTHDPKSGYRTKEHPDPRMRVKQR